MFGPLWWLDGLGHDYLPRRAHRVLLGWACDWCDSYLFREPK